MLARFGTAVTRGVALVFESVEAAKATERGHILVRNKLKEKAAAGAAPAAGEAAAPAAAPTEKKE